MKVWRFIKKVVRTAVSALVNFVKEAVVNAPATIVLVCGAVGATFMLSALPLEALCAPIPFITEELVVPVIAVLGMLGLATWAGATADVQV